MRGGRMFVELVVPGPAKKKLPENKSLFHFTAPLPEHRIFASTVCPRKFFEFNRHLCGTFVCHATGRCQLTKTLNPLWRHFCIVYWHTYID